MRTPSAAKSTGLKKPVYRPCVTNISVFLVALFLDIGCVFGMNPSAIPEPSAERAGVLGRLVTAHKLLVVGETHSVLSVQQDAILSLGALKKMGYTTIAFELPASRQKYVKDFMSGKLTLEQASQKLLTAKEGPSEAGYMRMQMLAWARDNGMKVILVDDDYEQMRDLIAQDMALAPSRTAAERIKFDALVSGRSESMARNIDRHLNKNPAENVVLFVGAAHAATPYYMDHFSPEIAAQIDRKSVTDYSKVKDSAVVLYLGGKPIDSPDHSFLERQINEAGHAHTLMEVQIDPTKKISGIHLPCSKQSQYVISQ